MNNSLTECRFPTLNEPYSSALKEAVAFILGRFDVLGMIASGTIIRGNPGPSSDLDLYVLHPLPERQRLQKFFNGVPAEIFVNPRKAVEGYLQSEQHEGRPITAHMLVTGFVIIDRDPLVEDLRQQAQRLLDEGPRYDDRTRVGMRYMAATLYEDAVDIAASNPANASMILGMAVYQMLHYAFVKSDRFIPRDKDLLEGLREISPALSDSARKFHETADFGLRFQLAEEIANLTIETHGFFEWESALEKV